jgi:hypothetical protein
MLTEEEFDEIFDQYYESLGLKPGFTQDEWNEYYLASLEELARQENGEYEKEILNMMKMIIDDKDYAMLHSILCNYDILVKKEFGEDYENMELPYWSYVAMEGYKEP